MDQQDKSFMMTFTVVLSAIVLIAVVIFLIAKAISALSIDTAGSERRNVLIERRLAPAGQFVAMGEGGGQAQAAAGGAAKSGQEVYDSACQACHAAGVLNAPKQGDEAAWTARFDEKGLDTLVKHAIEGFNAMPAKGGAANLSDAEVQAGVVFMLNTANIDVPEAEAAPADSAPAEPAAAEAAPADAAPTESAAAGVAEQPAAEQPAGDTAEASTAEPDLANGEAVYNQACVACHAAGVLNAPKLGDAEAWGTRYDEKGFDTLVKHAIEGFNAMPAKGGQTALSDDDIVDSVAYMLDAAAIDAANSDAAEAPAEPQAAPTEQPAEAAAGEASAEQAPTADEETSAMQGDGSDGSSAAEAAATRAAEAAERAATAAEKAAAAAEEAAGLAAEIMSTHQDEPVGGGESEAQEEGAAPAADPAGQQPAPEGEPQSGGASSSDTSALEIPQTLDLARGEQLYNTACIICHDAGVAGAPRFGDAAAWSPRLTQGWDTLAANSLNGYNGMPAKGGRMDVPDEDILAAVAFMVNAAR